jgi:hypothetical protein
MLLWMILAQWSGFSACSLWITALQIVSQEKSPIHPALDRYINNPPRTMTRVLLTGGSGFIAAHILDLLLKHGYELASFEYF